MLQVKGSERSEVLNENEKQLLKMKNIYILTGLFSIAII
jgi:hypothetical protein